MTEQTLSGIRVAILATDGFEQAELMEPRGALDSIGADTVVISPKRDAVRGWNMKQWGEQVPVDKPLAGADPDDYDALLLPGGVINADALRMIGEAVDFVGAFFDDRKPVAAICHAPWILIESRNVKGRTLTSWPSLKTDLINGGAHWVNQEVVVDGELVTSRKPDDIPSFNREITRLFDRIGRQHERHRHSDNPRRAV
jgi:protease I